MMAEASESTVVMMVVDYRCPYCKSANRCEVDFGNPRKTECVVCRRSFGIEVKLTEVEN